MSQLTYSIDDLLEQMVARGASDLHVTVGTPPAIRLRGHLERIEGAESLTADNTQQLLYRVLSSEQQKQLEIKRQLDFAYAVPGVARFRVNVFFQREALGAAFRVIPHDIKSLEELGLPASLHAFTDKPRGLVLVTGPTGSGKSTTLAAIIDEINRTRSDHILTIEDPIEFVHKHKRCIVNQREIGPDAVSFGEALRAALRQDPDVILLGEMRDLETISTALTAAETGHLVFGTLHTQSASYTVDRIIDVFPAEQQEQVRIMIAGSLQGVEVGIDPAEPEAADEPAKSLLKKEIHLFGGKKKAPKASKAPKEPNPAKAPRAEGDAVPWYKKEVSLKKGKAAEAEPEETTG